MVKSYGIIGWQFLEQDTWDTYLYCKIFYVKRLRESCSNVALTFLFESSVLDENRIWWESFIEAEGCWLQLVNQITVHEQDGFLSCRGYGSFS